MTRTYTSEKEEPNILKVYFQCVLTVFGFLAGLVLIAFTFGRGSMTNISNLKPEDAFVMRIEQIQPIPVSENPRIVIQHNSLEELVLRGAPNLVVRVKITDRLPCVLDHADAEAGCMICSPHACSFRAADGSYSMSIFDLDPSDDIVHQHQRSASTYLKTPYELEIEETILGDCNTIGDRIIMNADYGFVERGSWVFGSRLDEYPIFRTGNEYILFFYVSENHNGKRRYELLNGGACAEILETDSHSFRVSTSLARNQLGEAMYDVPTLIDSVRAIYQKHPYQLTVYREE